MVRSGAANGLAEVLVAQGGESVQTLLPEILTNAGNRDAAIAKREGYLGLFIFLPATMRNDFVPLLPEVTESARACNYYSSQYVL